MSNISDNETFKKTLSSLPLNQQRQVGARFVANVLDLTDGRCTRQAQHIAEQRDITPEELEKAYQAVNAVYVATHPRSDISELDYAKQAAHLVAEACMTCVCNHCFGAEPMTIVMGGCAGCMGFFVEK